MIAPVSATLAIVGELLSIQQTIAFPANLVILVHILPVSKAIATLATLAVTNYNSNAGYCGRAAINTTDYCVSCQSGTYSASVESWTCNSCPAELHSFLFAATSL